MEETRHNMVRHGRSRGITGAVINTTGAEEEDFPQVTDKEEF
jgi:hypothetical protein